MATITTKNEQLTVKCGEVTLRVDLGSGYIESLEFHGLPLINVGGETGAGLEVNVEGLAPAGGFSNWESEEIPGGVRLRLIYEFDDGDANVASTRKYLATQIFTFAEQPATVERRLVVKRLPTGDLTGPDVDRLRAATLSLAGVAVGQFGLTRVSAPMVRIVPGTPLSELHSRPRFFASATDPTDAGHYAVCMTAPDLVPGVVTLEDEECHHVSITPIPPRCAAHLRIFGQGEGVTIEHEFCCSSWMDVNDEIEAGVQVIMLQDAQWFEAMPAIGRLLAAHFPPKTDLPAWTDNAIVYESEPTFDGGFAGLRAKLPAIRDLGVNTVYLMPWHRGGYGTIDYYAPEPKYGTVDDLKATIRAAHDLGLKFMFDLLTNIIQPTSPMVKEHPEFFYRDDRGLPRPHVAWGGRGLDPASPAFRKYFTDYACWCVGELGADGFRIDADAHRGANWNCLPALQPHEHSHAVFTLLDEIRDAIRKLNPHAILMPECFGPIQSAIGDMVCYQWIEWVDWAMDLLAADHGEGSAYGREMTGSDFQRALAEQIMAMPAGTKFTYYSHTHDSLAFLKRDVRGPLAQAYFASTAFLGAGVMFFGGGWGMAPRPEPDEIDQYRRIFALRNQLNGFKGYATDFPCPPDIDLCVFTKTNGADCYTCATNFSENDRPMEVEGALLFSRTRESRPHSGGVDVAAYDTIVIKS